MAYAFSNFHRAMRVLLGDRGSSVAGYDWDSEQLDSGLAAVVEMGLVPCLEISGDNALSAAPPNRATWGFLAAKSVHLLVGGDTPQSVRTRALSVTRDPAARRDTLSHIETLLSGYEAEGLVCASLEDQSYRGPMEMVQDEATFFQLACCHAGCGNPCLP